MTTEKTALPREHAEALYALDRLLHKHHAVSEDDAKLALEVILKDFDKPVVFDVNLPGIVQPPKVEAPEPEPEAAAEPPTTTPAPKAKAAAPAEPVEAPAPEAETPAPAEPVEAPAPEAETPEEAPADEKPADA